MGYRFQQTGSAFGEDLDDLGAPLAEQLLAAVESGQGQRFATPAAWRDDWARQMGSGPDVVGFEIWDVYEGAKKAPAFRMIYFGDSDSGMLFHAGSARSAGLVLWPEGFRQKHTRPAADAQALDAAYRAARAKQLGR